MANPIKSVIIQKKLAGVLHDLNVRTDGENVIMPGAKTLIQYFSDYLTGTQVNSAISTAISNLINGAPNAFDTLKEIADWIEEHEDLYLALVAAIDGKVDKVTGYGLSKNDLTDTLLTKLNGIEAGANNYTHPANHAPSIITQDSTNRFVTDAQIAAWNAAAGGMSALDLADATTDGLMSKEDWTKLDGIEAGANNYTHPANHAPSIITQDTNNRFVTDAEKVAWNAAGRILSGTTAPLDLTDKDLFFEILP